MLMYNNNNIIIIYMYNIIIKIYNLVISSYLTNQSEMRQTSEFELKMKT